MTTTTFPVRVPPCPFPVAPRPVRKPRPKLVPSFRLLAPLDVEGATGLLEITMGKESTTYFLERVPSDWGQGFRLEKVRAAAEDADVYLVHLTGDGDTCECPGFCKWQRCKHARSLRELSDCGKI